MDYNNKRRVANRVIYIVLAIMLAAIMMITIFAIFSNISKRSEKAPELPETTAEETHSNNVITKTETSAPETTSDTVPETNLPSEDAISPVVSPITNLPADEDKETAKNYTLPVAGNVTKKYSYDTPVYSLTMNDYRAHLGIDISASEGDPVYAFMSGTVTDVSSDYFMGTCVTIDHKNGFVSKYMNISDELPKSIGVGAEVDCGQLIASVKDTALIEAADDTHLHFELLKDGNHVDPLLYTDYDTAVISYED